MGFNSTLVIRNDAAGMIEKDTDFGAKVIDGIRRFDRSKDPVRISSFCSDAARVVACDHDRSFQGLVVGLCSAWSMGFAGSWSERMRDCMTEEQRKIEFLRNMADALGYRLVKRRQ